uniref:TetR_C_7 domain-containing protein n=1 Tax=Panagrellus redivivus TaxID=6233 RepID=A0A7E4VS86_PANRE
MVVYAPNPRSFNQVKECYAVVLRFPTHLERAVSKAASDRIIERVLQRNPRRFLFNSEAKRRIHMMANALIVKAVAHLAQYGDPNSEVIQSEEVTFLFDVLLSARRAAAA